MKPLLAPSSAPARQAGLATLLTVVVILAIVTLVSMYANRAVFLEQKSANNYYHSAKSLGAAEAGLDSIFASLQADKDAMKTPGAATRLVCLDTSGNVRFLTANSSGKACPADSSASAATKSVSAGLVDSQEAYTVTLTVNADGKTINISSQGCSDTKGTSCSASDSSTSTLQTSVNWGSALNTRNAAMTSKADYHQNGSLHVTKVSDSPDPAYSVLAGGDYGMGGSSGVGTICKQGSTSPASCPDDSNSVAGEDDWQFFQSTFGTTPDLLRTKAKIYKSNSTSMNGSSLPPFPASTGLNAAAITGLGTQVIWVEGDLTLNGSVTFGSNTKPIVLIINGNLNLRGTTNNIFGFLYVVGAVGDEFSSRCHWANDSDLSSWWTGSMPHPGDAAGCSTALGGALSVTGALAIEGSIVNAPDSLHPLPWKSWRDGISSTTPNSYDTTNHNVTRYRFSYQNYGTTAVYYDKNLLDQIELDPVLKRSPGKWKDF
ncbi:pilus assembly PilX family protein [Jeongeupia naejangsanensis]|uniref:Type 4 fimbrial biogenesis protein PilX N-terminal domain-containing protein n=1 Tax=Jeongeupia naejangsanensis TaxID=613195 RepID=A0ABS2BGF0_9NEIS|nr:PilX N-terminal domain-containing pilus assembly protein [Jeongeupia naejangsanensis]MBM3114684.1 hypothetical protein [Jeongeupia naejangsanensis]